MKFLFTLIVFATFSTQASSTINGFDVEVYGFIKASTFYADKALGSYNSINLSAPTHAVAETRDQDKTSRMSFQTQQSRLGFNLKKEEVSAKLEFDFIDFNKSSPTTQMVPRVRIASVTYEWDTYKLIIGQDWDIFSPVTSYTFDYVGLYFLAGNTGFMRQQLQFLNQNGVWELGAALGMAGNNSKTADGNLEQGKSPSYAMRVSRKLDKGRTGLSGIYSSLSYVLSNGTRHDAYGFNWFYEKILGQLSLKSEFYYGQNLANLGALSIGLGSDTRDVKEYGGTFTFIYKLNDLHTCFAGTGLARVDNPSEILPFAMNPVTGSLDSAGIDTNFLQRMGYEYKITSDLSWISELSRLQTISKISDDKYQQNSALGIESGVQLRF